MVDRKSRDLMADEITPGTCRLGTVGDKQVAIFNVDGQFYATQAECTHRGGPLCEGALWGDIVTCPWHGLEFHVPSGRCVAYPDVKLRTFEVVERDGDVVVVL